MEISTIQKQFHANMMNKLNRERKSAGTYCDVTLMVMSNDDIFISCEFHAHKCILGKVSKYFECLIKTEMAYIDGVDEETMSIILDFIYCCNIKLNHQNVYKVLEASEFMRIQHLKELCLEYLNKLLDVTNCFMMRSFARKHNYSHLAHVADLIIEYQPDDILRQCSFNDLCFDDVAELMRIKRKKDPCSIKEIEEETILLTLVGWVRHNLIRRRQHFQDIFGMIKTDVLSKDCLQSLISKENLMNEIPECLLIVNSILSDCIAKERLVAEKRLKAEMKKLSAILRKIVYFNQGFLVVNESTSFVYDVTEKLLFKMPDLKYNHSGGSTVNFNNEIYVIGGESERLVENLNLKNASSGWVDVACTNECRWIAASTVCGDYIYTVGGMSSPSSGEKYDACANSWSKIRNMNKQRCDHCLVSFEGKLYVFGGRDSGPLNSAECFDPLTNRWKMLPSMKLKRQAAAAVVFDEAIYVIGGYDGDGALSSVDRFHPHDESWDAVAFLNQSRYWHGACVVNRKIYVAGGKHSLNDDVDTIEVYDATKNIWEIESNFKALECRISIAPVSTLSNFEMNI